MHVFVNLVKHLYLEIRSVRNNHSCTCTADVVGTFSLSCVPINIAWTVSINRCVLLLIDYLHSLVVRRIARKLIATTCHLNETA